MTGEVIQRISYLIPADDIRAVVPPLGTEIAALPGDKLDHRSNRMAPEAERVMAKATFAYRELAYGWKAASYFAKHRKSFPTVIGPDDSLLWQAYLMQCDWRRYSQRHIQEAYAIAGYTSMQTTKWTLEACLMDPVADLHTIAERTGIPLATVMTYEKLFCNVMDRKHEHAMISGVVYPNGRIVENFENYIDRESFGNILMRVGYNEGIDQALHMAGYGGDLLTKLGKNNPSAQLETKLIINGLLLANAGWMNQRHHNTGLMHAKGLLQAAKMGGEQSMAGVAVFATFGDSLKEAAIASGTEKVKYRDEPQPQAIDIDTVVSQN